LEKFQKIFSTSKNRRLFIFALTGLVLITTLVNFRILDHEKEMILIPGERPSRVNFTPVIAKNRRFQQGRSLELLAARLPENESHFLLVYKFTVTKSGSYQVLLAGTPPASITPGSDWDWFSPYWIAIDNGTPVRLTKEAIEQDFPHQLRWVEYVKGGYHWVRTKWVYLEPGIHTLEIRVDEKRFRDGRYAFFLDSILLVPDWWKPVRLLKQVPKEFFDGM